MVRRSRPGGASAGEPTRAGPGRQAGTSAVDTPPARAVLFAAAEHTEVMDAPYPSRDLAAGHGRPARRGRIPAPISAHPPRPRPARFRAARAGGGARRDPPPHL